MAPLTFRNSRIVYYGPHECSNCGILIAKMGDEWGGTAFTYPSGPVYPNTEWHPHVCDPFEVKKRKGIEVCDPPSSPNGNIRLEWDGIPAWKKTRNPWYEKNSC